MSNLESLALALAITFAGLLILRQTGNAADKYAAEYAEDDALTRAAAGAPQTNVIAEVTFKARLTPHGWVVVATE